MQKPVLALTWHRVTIPAALRTKPRSHSDSVKSEQNLLSARTLIRPTIHAHGAAGGGIRGGGEHGKGMDAAGIFGWGGNLGGNGGSGGSIGGD